MTVENRGTKERPRWRYSFMIRGVRYRAAVPEARLKSEAERAEVQAKKAVFEGRYGRPSGAPDLVGLVENEYAPWGKDNKRSCHNEASCAPRRRELCSDE